MNLEALLAEGGPTDQSSAEKPTVSPSTVLPGRVTPLADRFEYAALLKLAPMRIVGVLRKGTVNVMASPELVQSRVPGSSTCHRPLTRLSRPTTRRPSGRRSTTPVTSLPLVVTSMSGMALPGSVGFVRSLIAELAMVYPLTSRRPGRFTAGRQPGRAPTRPSAAGARRWLATGGPATPRGSYTAPNTRGPAAG